MFTMHTSNNSKLTSQIKRPSLTPQLDSSRHKVGQYGTDQMGAWYSH